MDHHVTLRTLPERYMTNVRQIIPAYENEGMFWGFLAQETTAMNLRMTSPCYSMAVFHDKEFKENDVDMGIQMSVTDQYKDTERVTFKTAPAVEMTSATCKGSYDQIAPINEAVVNWVTQNGYEFNGPCFWIYHVGLREARNPEEYVTKICYPVKRK